MRFILIPGMLALGANEHPLIRPTLTAACGAAVRMPAQLCVIAEV